MGISIKSNNLKQSNSFNGVIISIIVCISIIVGTFNNIFSYAALILSAIALVALSEEDALCFMMFIMPFANIFKSSPEAQSFFTYLLLFYALYYLLKKRTIATSFVLPFLLLIAFLIGQMLISINILRTIKFIVNILFIYLVVSSKACNNDKKIYLHYICGIGVSSAVAALDIIPNLINYIGANYLDYSYGGDIRFAGLYGDPNYYSINVIVSLCLIVVLNHKKQLKTIPAIALAAIMVIFATMTFSKSAFLMLLLPLLMLLYSKIKSRKYFVFSALGVAAAVFLVNLFSGEIEIFDVVISRLASGEDISSLTSSRSDLWLNYINHLWENGFDLLFGVGFGGSLLNERAAHNTYIDLIYYLGIIGSILLIVTILSVSKTRVSPLKRTALNYGVIACLALMYFSLSELFYFDLAFHIVLAILVYKTDFFAKQEG